LALIIVAGLQTSGTNELMKTSTAVNAI
jgi:hypothetical protein